MNNLESYLKYEFHAHVYYCRDTFKEAKSLIEEISRKFSFEIGTMHEKPVGPHPLWSCQVKFYRDDFGPFVQWLILNRGKLNIFIQFIFWAFVFGLAIFASYKLSFIQ